MSFTRPKVVLNLYEFLCSVELKRRYFEVTKQFLVPNDFSSDYVSQWGPTITNVLPTFFKISSFVVSRRKKLMQV